MAKRHSFGFTAALLAAVLAGPAFGAALEAVPAAANGPAFPGSVLPGLPAEILSPPALRALDPKAAAPLARVPAALLRLRESPARAAPVLARAFAVRDLAGLLESERGSRLLQGLRLRFDGEAPLGELSSEGALLSWVGAYLPRRLGRVRSAVLSWETLSASQKEWLASQGVTREAWDLKPIHSRDLSGWAGKALEDWERTPYKDDPRAWRAFVKEARRIDLAMAGEKRARMQERIEGFHVLLRSRRELGRKASAENDLETIARLDRMAALPVSEQLAALPKAGEGLQKSVDLLRPSRPEEVLSEDEAGLLVGAIFSELAGTKSGEGVLDFYKGRPPKVRISRLVSSGAQFDPESEVMDFDRDFIESWLRVNGHAARDLREDPAVLRGLARLLAPIFVHETEHYRQHLWRRQNGLLFFYLQEDEIGAYEAEARFVQEKSALDPAYVQEVHPVDRALVSTIDKDPSGFRRRVRRGYPHLMTVLAETAACLHLYARLSPTYFDRIWEDPPEDAPRFYRMFFIDSLPRLCRFLGLGLKYGESALPFWLVPFFRGSLLHSAVRMLERSASI
jgi:hypothetical protein